MAKSIKENREKYLSDMDSYISKLEKMSKSEKQQHAQQSLRNAGIITRSGKLSPVYK